MALSPTALNGIQNTPVLRSSGVPDIDPNVKKSIKELNQKYTCFGADYTNKRNMLLGFLNDILNKGYSFGANGLDIEKIFNENSFSNSNTICNAGKKAYAYYLKEVLQKLNLLNQYILKGQKALNTLKDCTNEAQIKKYETILEIQDELVKKVLNDFNKYTVIQTLTTTRTTIRKKITGGTDVKGNDTILTETNYATKGKIWDENGNVTGKFELNTLSSLQDLRTLTTVKESGLQIITTTLTNKHTSETTDLNDEFGFNVVNKQISINKDKEESTPIALFDELTLLEKLKYIRVYYTDNTTPYNYPEDLKSGVPCMSRDELKTYVYDANKNGSNDDELQELGIIPSKENAPKTDLVEPGAVELFYVGYLEDSQGAINALAAFMEIKSVSMLVQITQQSYRVKALKTYLQMLEIGLQELNSCYEKDSISTKTYLAIKYAAANQTRTLVNINGSDYIVLQVDGEKESGNYEHYNLSDKQAYIYVKATTEGINEFLGMQWDAVDTIFKQFSITESFQELTDPQIKEGYDNGTEFGQNPTFNNKFSDSYNYLYKEVKIGGYYTITTDGEKYRHYDGWLVHEYVNTKELIRHPLNINDEDPDNKRMIQNKDLGWRNYDCILYQKQIIVSSTTLTSQTGNVLFAKFNNNEQAINNLPKELETAKVSMNDILNDKFAGENISWRHKDDKRTSQWRRLVEMWQNVCQTAIENIGSQIESVNKTIKSLRSKIDTFDSSANRFRDKFYSTIMTAINKIS